MKEQLLREPALTLSKTLDVCRAAEASRQQIRAMTEAEVASINPIAMHRGKSQQRQYGNKRTGGSSQSQSQLVTNCRYCSGTHN